jgi:2,4'-dihydroxyacetophenone dioxygenase
VNLLPGGTAFAEAVHRGADDLPWVDLGGRNKMRIAYVNRGQGVWIVQNVFQAGFEVEAHHHTGPVWGYTISGAWKYKEYSYVNRAGSFLYEPAGSVHSLECIEDDTLAWFHMTGSNLNLGADGEIVSITDGPGSLRAYHDLCEAQGLPHPNVVVE